MMHPCCSSQGNMGGSCSCGLFHAQANPFSMFFSMPNHRSFDEANMYHYASSPSSVDCTLSLGTPSTRMMTEKEEKRIRHDHRRPGSCVSNFCWDLLHPRNGPPQQKSSRGGNNGGGGAGVSNGCGDPLLSRRCANCDTTSTPLWRNGPRGPKSLCNACGIRFKKEERRASAAAANTSGNGAYSGVVMEGAWAYHHSQTQKSSPCFSASINNDYMFNEDENGGEADNSISFLSWRLNVTERPSLVHDFTR